MKRVARTNQPRAGTGGDDPRFAPVVAAFAADGQVERGKMFGSVGLKVNGKVFAMVVKGRLVVKLPRERVDALVASGNGDSFDPGHGKPMKEWISAAGTKPSWVELSREAYVFVKGGGR